MKRPQELEDSLIDLSRYPIDLVDGALISRDEALTGRIVDQVQNGSGFVVCHGVNRVLAAQGLDVHRAEDAELGRMFLEGIFRTAASGFDLTRCSAIDTKYDHVAKMDVDGYNKNHSFTPNGDHTASRVFVTTKCIHFDAATPFIANVYGPNENIQGGFPIICDTRRFCRERGVDPKTLVENIPNNYNVAVREEHYRELLDNYSFALDLDLDNDIIMTVLFNEVIGGVAHAATQPSQRDPAKPARRPIRHLEYQFANAEDLRRWYEHYGLTLEKATDYKDAPTGRNYHGGESNYDKVIQVAS